MTTKTTKEMTTPELLTEYNALTGKNIKKFSSRFAAERQVELARTAVRAGTLKPAAEAPKLEAKPTSKLMEATKKAAAKRGAKVAPTGKRKPAEPSTHETRSAAISESWNNKATRAARTTHHKVEVTDPRGEKTECRSVLAAFEHFSLPIGSHISFRGKLKASAGGKLAFVTDDGAYKFKLVTK